MRTRALPEGDHFRISGQKVFITYGEHDLVPNIIHAVLARTPTAPEGVKGLSLFSVPKSLVKADGRLGPRNDVCCVSMEKLRVDRKQDGHQGHPDGGDVPR